MTHIKKILSILLCFAVISLTIPSQTASALSTNSISFIILSQYKLTANIGDELYLLAVTSNGKRATWKSSDSKIASVNTYGIITAKKAGTVIITAKIKNTEAYCQVIVNKTDIIINTTSASLERGEILKLSAKTSNNSAVTWKSSKRSIATVDEYGTVTCKKPGETIITAKADGSSATCTLNVKYPTIQLNKNSITLYRGQSTNLSAIVSSNMNPTWKTNKKSVAVVSPTGNITAIKHGTAIITSTVDGVSTTCEVFVLKPDIDLSSYELSIQKGLRTTLTACVSSGNLPIWSTSNSKIVSINSNGQIIALKTGTAYIYASEDGTKARCTIHVTE